MTSREQNRTAAQAGAALPGTGEKVDKILYFKDLPSFSIQVTERNNEASRRFRDDLCRPASKDRGLESASRQRGACAPAPRRRRLWRRKFWLDRRRVLGLLYLLSRQDGRSGINASSASIAPRVLIQTRPRPSAFFLPRSGKKRPVDWLAYLPKALPLRSIRAVPLSMPRQLGPAR